MNAPNFNRTETSGPHADYPWLLDFYFNGEFMPKWSACWPTGFLNKIIKPTKESCDDIGDRDVYIIATKIDHVGVLESTSAVLFLFVLQRVLLLLLKHPKGMAAAIRKFEGCPNPNEVWSGLVDGAFLMRELVLRDRLAIWTSGHEADRTEMQKVVEKCRLTQPHKELLPHQKQLSLTAHWMIRDQVRDLHQVAQNRQGNKELRTRLHQLKMPPEDFFRFVT